ncbi:MAG TPA: FAD-dependent oxidoreductase [Polyangiaceae bacterium]|nr:FAD-dependent oxidoreductase [Polyangiaceae bacterium]
MDIDPHSDPHAVEAPPIGPALRVAIVGSGPAAFYSADFLLRDKSAHVEVDMFERLPTPYGLVRFGVAPDHQSIKRVISAFERIAGHASFRFFGNVEIGRDLPVELLVAEYHAIVFATGSASDKRLGVPGEDLAGSAPATAFVGWYNGHPDFQNQRFDLSSERAVVVGMGNVAMDVARILIRAPHELSNSDITHDALRALHESRVREIVLLGRRGAAQAAFDQAELADIAELADVAVSIDGDLPPIELSALDAAARKNVEYLQKLASSPAKSTARRVRLRFQASPVEILGQDRVTGIVVEHNTLQQAADGSVSARGSGKLEEISCGLVFRSIGYRGVAIAGVPFDEARGVIPNQHGRILGADGHALPGFYTAGWIKRGPTGLVGTNKSDAKETVQALLADARLLQATHAPCHPERIVDRLRELGLRALSFADWQKLDLFELEAGKAKGKVREKLVSVEAMLSALEARRTI